MISSSLVNTNQNVAAPLRCVLQPFTADITSSQSLFGGPPALFGVCISLYNLLSVGGKGGAGPSDRVVHVSEPSV